MAATYVRRVNRYKDKSKISLEQFNNYVSILRDEGPDAVKEQVSVWLILVLYIRKWLRETRKMCEFI